MHLKVGQIGDNTRRGISKPIRNRSLKNPSFSHQPCILGEEYDLKAIKESLIKVDHDIAEMICKRDQQEAAAAIGS